MLRSLAAITSLSIAAFAIQGCSDASFSSPPTKVPSPATWQLVYQHDTTGAPIKGSKQALFDAIRRGSPVRVAWGFKSERADITISTEHIAEPVFLTIINESEVVVQIPEHIAQASYVNPDKAEFDIPAVMWRSLMSTDGSFDAVWVNRATGEEIRRLHQKAGLAWFVFQPTASSELAKPVTLATADGMRSTGRSTTENTEATEEEPAMPEPPAAE